MYSDGKTALRIEGSVPADAMYLQFEKPEATEFARTAIKHDAEGNHKVLCRLMLNKDKKGMVYMAVGRMLFRDTA